VILRGTKPDPSKGPDPEMKPRRLAVYGLTAGLLGGGAAGLLLTGTTLASTRIADVTSVGSASSATVSDPAPNVSDPSTTTAAAASPAPASGSGAGSAPKGGDWAKAALDPLVAKGTITRAQEDAVLAALQAAHPADGPGRGRGPGGPGFGNLDVAAKALGMTADDLRTALQGGKTLADVAKAKGVDPAKVVDALVADLTAHLDADVASGEHTQAEADQILAQAKTRIQDFVNGTAPAGGPGGPGGFGGHGPGGHGPGGPAGSGAGPGSGSGSTNGSGTTGTTA